MRHERRGPRASSVRATAAGPAPHGGRPARGGLRTRLAGWEGHGIALAVIAAVAGVFLFWNLTDTYLWQDEANTAVLAVRLFQHGKPLAWDGRNLLSDDNFAAQDRRTIDTRTHDPAPAVQDLVRRGAMTADGMWTYHPWGQFVVAGSSIALFGRTTFAARFPFALAALAAVLSLYWFAWRTSRSRLMAVLACAALVLNAYWLLHGRQARYYSLSSLLLLLTVVAYARWQRGARGGAVVFATVAWCWFQVDYGTVWPVFAVLFADALLHALRTRPRDVWKPVATGLGLGLAILPFVFFYRLDHRKSGQLGTWLSRFHGAVFNLNEYVVPALVLVAAIAVLVVRRRDIRGLEARLIAVLCAIFVALAVWVPTVAPMTFVRYVIMAAPLGAMLTAWVFVRGLGPYATRYAWIGVAVVALTPWPSRVVPVRWAGWRARTGTFLRSELSLLGSDILRHRPDPNRLVIEWLQRNAAPNDEILVNYEDLPMMYYLPNPIRGGIVAFRAEDDRVTPPRFAVMRRTVPFVHWPVFQREIARYFWTPVPVRAPDVRWGNNPDPQGHFQDPSRAEELLFYQRVDTSAAPGQATAP